MKIRLLIVAVVLSVAVPASAQDEADLVPLFPREAPVVLSGPGLTRLPLPAEVLRGARQDLADVRLFDAEDREVPFLIDSGARPVAPAPPTVAAIDARTLELSTTEAARPGGLGPAVRETYLIEVPDGAWDLVVVTPRSHFVRHVSVYDDTRGGVRLASGSVFRLPSPAQEQTRIGLPAGLPRVLRVVVDGTERPLEAAFRFEAARAEEVPETFEVRLAEVARRRDGAKTVVELARPLGIVPTALRIETATPMLDRPVVVRDGGQGARAGVIGRATALRIPDLAVDERAIRVEPASGDRLVVTIDDGGSPPLEALTFAAIVERPAIVFHARDPVTLRFGGARAHAPGYDLARFAGTTLGRSILVGGEAREAALGAIRDNPRFDPRPALEFAMRPGPAIDPRRSTHYRALRVDAAPEGLSRLQLGPDEVAHARADLGDVRIVDADDHTWPYLLEREGIVAEVPVHPAVPRREGRATRYLIPLPAASLLASELSLAPRAAYVDRAYRVYGRIELPELRRARAREGDDEVLLGEGRLVRRPGDESPLCIPLASHRVVEMWLVIEDGDDPPLAFDSAALSMPTADLYLVAPPGDYRLLVGDAESPAARHEIARARDLVHAVQATPITARGRLEENPRYLPRDTGLLPTALLWIAIVLAVLVLAFLTIRLARTEAVEVANG